MNSISETEFKQLGTLEKNSVPYFNNLEDWLKFRKFLVEKSKKRNPDHFDENLAAYTPGETLALLSKKEIVKWFEYLDTMEIPKDAKAIVLVPCAASKPWFKHKNINKSKLYKAYNEIIKDMDEGKMEKVYFLTISEPLGIVPQDRWHDFPKYDNPGLFKDDFLRTGLVKTDWAKTFLKQKYLLPFDKKAYEECITRLAQVIEKALCKIDIPIISFVDAKEHTTHGHMLDVVEKNNQNIKIVRHMKKAEARLSPYEHIKDTIAAHLNQNLPLKKIKAKII